MTSPGRFSIWLALLLGCMTGSANAAITIVNPGGGNHIHSSSCPAGDGGNILVPDPVLHQQAGGPAGMIAELQGGDTPFPGWTFQVGPALTGTLTVDIYKSQFLGNHFSGGEIEARYTRGATDPTNLRWVQMVSTNRPLGGATSPYIDPFPNDDNRPFYWTETEDADHSSGVNGFGAYDKHFSDFSRRSHPPTSNAGWTGYLMLASWDGNTPGVVTIHDGILWGWSGGCTSSSTTVPSTSSWGILAVVLLLLSIGIWRIHRGRRAAGEPAGA